MAMPKNAPAAGPNLVTIYGGSGFVGRYVARRMARAGWRVRVACRNPNEALFVKVYGNVGQVEPVFCNVRDDASVAAVMEGADAVVNCVGILEEAGRNTFRAVQEEGAERIARLAVERGIGRMVQISAIGADPGSKSAYARTKAAGEAAVLRHLPDAVILRPSIVFGPEDEFFNRFASMARFGPVLPVVGAGTLFQPVYVDDVAHAAEKALTGAAMPGIYELGGPDVATFRELMEQMLDVIGRRRLIGNIPFPLASAMGWGAGAASRLSFGLVPQPVTVDQVRNLRRDNVVAGRAMTFADLGIEPMSMEAILPGYLWRFRKGGEYAEITESAKDLREDI
ncbi:NADH dehydrogenase [Hasllibacter halocynthiae]|uniref:NADH dehydrogenase n=1 Tax=Hasllibacter halocynthiae TaxID=595589 RepID=A0A2T0X236_9RHOB|nr:complex I NDUFA9 subunit family protein [Hasllibacter halocynthiae]PRY93000.1 NADH dehydrogenase [Hasllibacter halocynthiae]